MMLSLDEAFEEYERARPRLPRARTARRSMPARNLDDLSDRFDAFLLDAFGVLNVGDTAIPGARERVAGLRARGKRVMVLTNAASVPSDRLVEKYARLGFDFAAEDVISSRAILVEALRDQPVGLWGVMAPRNGPAPDLDGLAVEHLEDDPATYARVDAFVLLGSHGWTERRHALLEAALAERPRSVWVGNPDFVAPRETGLSVEPGYYAHRLAVSLADVDLRFFGKPFDAIFHRAFARLGSSFDPARTVMVGDTLHTDILGAQAAGVSAALVSEFGFFAGRDVDPAIAATGITPDFIVSRP